ncbi:hypothetical protein ALI144C_06845 [Actinosynnema sp. ALI-1.44]|nr:hypothetical protein ALI144C_06845 [Actinosynnema sp. ALI-1.44]
MDVLDIGEVEATVSCELMDNIMPVFPVKSSERVMVIQDSSGEPVVFSLDPEKRLRIRRFIPGSPGWQVSEILQDVIDFDIEQSQDGRVSAVFLTGTSEVGLMSGGRTIQVADWFDPSSVDFGKLKNEMWQKSFVDGWLGQRVKMNILGAAAGRGERGAPLEGPDLPFIVALGKSANKWGAYATIGRSLGTNHYVNLPEELAESDLMPTFDVGYVGRDRRTVWMAAPGHGKIYYGQMDRPDDQVEMREVQVEWDENSPGRATKFHQLAVGAVPAPVLAGPGDRPPAPGRVDLGPNIYVVTDRGIAMFPSGRGLMIRLNMVAEGHRFAETHSSTAADGTMPEVRELAVLERHGDEAAHVSLWALCAGNRLFCIRGESDPNQYQSPEWGQPLLFSSRVEHVQSCHNTRWSSDEVFVVEKTSETDPGTTVHYWQDPISGHWSRRGGQAISTPPENDPENRWTSGEQRDRRREYVHTYTSHIQLHRKDGAPLANARLAIRSSEWVYGVANGEAHSFGPDNSVEIRTDDMGTLTVMAEAVGINSPELWLCSGDFPGETLRVRPDGNAHRKLYQPGALRDAEIDQTPQTKDIGDRILPTLLTAAKKKIPDNDGGYVFASVESRELCASGDNPAYAALHLEGFPSDRCGFEVGVGENGTAYLIPQARPGHDDFYGFGISWDFLSPVGDGLQAVGAEIADLYHKAEQAVGFVFEKVGEAINFAVSIAGKVITFALETALDVLKAVNSVLSAIGLDIRKLTRWLGHALGWKDIRKVQKFMAKLLDEGLSQSYDFSEKLIEKAKKETGKFLRTLRGQLKDRKPQAHRGMPSMDPRHSLALSTPAFGMVKYHIGHGDLAEGANEEVDNEKKSPPPYKEELLDALIDTGKDLADAMQKLVGVTIESINSDPAETSKKLQGLLLDSADTLIKDDEKLINALLDGVLSFVKDLCDMRNESADALIPGLAEIYRLSTYLFNEKEDDQDSPTILNCLSLLLAIPYVELNRALGNDCFPLSDDEAREIEKNVFRDAFNFLADDERGTTTIARPGSPEGDTAGAQWTAAELLGKSIWPMASGVLGIIGGMFSTYISANSPNVVKGSKGVGKGVKRIPYFIAGSRLIVSVPPLIFEWKNRDTASNVLSAGMLGLRAVMYAIRSYFSLGQENKSPLKKARLRVVTEGVPALVQLIVNSVDMIEDWDEIKSPKMQGKYIATWAVWVRGTGGTVFHVIGENPETAMVKPIGIALKMQADLTVLIGAIMGVLEDALNTPGAED